MTTTPIPTPDLPAACLARIEALMASGQRRLLGLVGPPGAGKSTLAAALHQAQPTLSQVVPMDGYHLANAELRRLGRAGRKGAPDTFDSAGYVALLRRLREQQGPAGDAIVYAPEFHRDIEEGVAGSVPVFAATQLVITEGNYLLLDEGPWAAAAALLDEVWYVEVDDRLRTDRLVRRHEHFGRSAEAARAWVAGTDEPNARLIEGTRGRATWVFRWGD